MPPQPIAETVSEEAAEHQQVDNPEIETVEPLDADRTEVEGIEDTGAIWDQTYPGEDQPVPKADSIRLMANRVTVVSDTVLFGAAVLGPDTEVFQLVPAHRDRLRVTIQVIQDLSAPDVYISSDRNITPTANAWHMQDISPLRLETRDGIYCLSVGGENTTRIQWAAELVSESPGH